MADQQYLIQGSTLNNIANQIQILVSDTSAFTPIEMTSQLETANSEITEQTDLIRQILEKLNAETTYINTEWTFDDPINIEALKTFIAEQDYSDTGTSRELILSTPFSIPEDGGTEYAGMRLSHYFDEGEGCSIAYDWGDGDYMTAMNSSNGSWGYETLTQITLLDEPDATMLAFLRSFAIQNTYN